MISLGTDQHPGLLRRPGRLPFSLTRKASMSNPPPQSPQPTQVQSPPDPLGAVAFTDTERKILILLDDGMPHPRKELIACLTDPNGGNLSSVHFHMSNLRRKLRLVGQDVICGLAGRRIFYQRVRLMIRNDTYKG